MAQGSASMITLLPYGVMAVLAYFLEAWLPAKIVFSGLILGFGYYLQQFPLRFRQHLFLAYLLTMACFGKSFAQLPIIPGKIYITEAVMILLFLGPLRLPKRIQAAWVFLAV